MTMTLFATCTIQYFYKSLGAMAVLEWTEPWTSSQKMQALFLGLAQTYLVTVCLAADLPEVLRY